MNKASFFNRLACALIRGLPLLTGGARLAVTPWRVSMALDAQSSGILRFATFEVDLRAGELRKQGKRIKVQEQPFHVLTVLLQRR
jgi:DNA-binding response OmpR family regulator